MLHTSILEQSSKTRNAWRPQDNWDALHLAGWVEDNNQHFIPKEVNMGLDANAGFQKPQPKNVEPIDIYDTMESKFYWRKHARLQQFMMAKWHANKGEETPFGVMGSDFNGGNILWLEKDDILELQDMVKNGSLPFCPDGFFWGHQFQEESMSEYKQQDLDFCKEALKWLEEGKKVWYDCSW